MPEGEKAPVERVRMDGMVDVLTSLQDGVGE